VALVQFFGNFIADRLPYTTHGHKTTDDSRFQRTDVLKPNVSSEADTVNAVTEVRVENPDMNGQPHEMPNTPEDLAEMENWTGLPDMTQPMQFEKISGNPSLERQPVFARDDGLVSVTCSRCGGRESLPLAQFDKLGNAIEVTCPCHNQFMAVLEKRRSVRKHVQLEGYFSVSGDLNPTADEGSIWGPMMVIDISKFGLRFSSEKAHLIHPGNQLMVRFNLDNTNQALIHKPVKVISISGFEVGCQFQGEDSYDITLGFYFM